MPLPPASAVHSSCLVLDCCVHRMLPHACRPLPRRRSLRQPPSFWMQTRTLPCGLRALPLASPTFAHSKALADASMVGWVGDEQLPKDSSSHLLAVAPRAEHPKSCACASCEAATAAAVEERLACHAATAVDREVRGGDDAGPLVASGFRRSLDTYGPCAPHHRQSYA